MQVAARWDPREGEKLLQHSGDVTPCDRRRQVLVPTHDLLGGGQKEGPPVRQRGHQSSNDTWKLQQPLLSRYLPAHPNSRPQDPLLHRGRLLLAPASVWLLASQGRAVPAAQAHPGGVPESTGHPLPGQLGRGPKGKAGPPVPPRGGVGASCPCRTVLTHRCRRPPGRTQPPSAVTGGGLDSDVCSSEHWESLQRGVLVGGFSWGSCGSPERRGWPVPGQHTPKSWVQHPEWRAHSLVTSELTVRRRGTWPNAGSAGSGGAGSAGGHGRWAAEWGWAPG